MTFRALQFKTLRIEIKERKCVCGQKVCDLLAEEKALYQEFDGANLRGLSTANLKREVSGLVRNHQESWPGNGDQSRKIGVNKNLIYGGFRLQG
jgi:hypothetical protein